MKRFHFHKLKYLFQRFSCRSTHFQELLMIFYIRNVQQTLTQDKLIRLHNISIDLMSEINQKFIRLLLLFSEQFIVTELYQNKYNGTDFSKDGSDKELLKSKLNKLGLSSHRKLKHNLLEESLSKKELESLKNLSKNPDSIVRKSDKGNSVAILDKKVLP